MLDASASPLVLGTPHNTMAKQVPIEVLRPFCIQSKSLNKGAKLDVDAGLAAELVSMGKAKRLPEPEKAAKPPKE